MNIRIIAHHLGLPVRRDRAEAEAIANNLASKTGAEDEKLIAAWADVLASDRAWHRPYLRAIPK